MNVLVELQKWYRSRCDGDWEHCEGIRIDTLDNPGWTIEISIRGTDLEGKAFRAHSYGVGEDALASGDDWLDCRVEDNIFKAAGGPFKLEEMIRVFLDWASGNGKPDPALPVAPAARPGDSEATARPIPVDSVELQKALPHASKPATPEASQIPKDR